MTNIEKIKNIVRNNNDILLIQDLKEYNIHRQYIKQLVDEKFLSKVARGIYVANGKKLNEFFLIGQKYRKGIFSHNTALYFYDLTDRTPIHLDLTFPSNINVNDNAIKVHYIKKDVHLLGAIKMKLADGTNINIYNLERTICDIIRDRNKIDPQIFNDAIRGYMKRKDKNLILLYKYAEKFKIENIISMYMEVL